MLAATKPHSYECRAKYAATKTLLAYQQTLTFLYTQIHFLSSNTQQQQQNCLRKLRIFFFDWAQLSGCGKADVRAYNDRTTTKNYVKFRTFRLKQMAMRIDTNDCEFA